LTVAGTLTAPDGSKIAASVELRNDDSSATLEFRVEDPQLWWPNGYGEHPLYKLLVELQSSDVSLDSKEMRIGLRTLKLNQDPDEWGRSFYFSVNGVPIWCKGGDWIPADQFPSRVTREHYRDLIRSCVGANMNMLRVWGGGIYEDDRFFNLCDEYGILVWQDFMFACAHYPVNQEMLDNISLEAVDNIRRIRHHPSLALWCGNNEMEWFLAGNWGAENNEAMRKEYLEIFYKLLPEVCAAEDPYTPFWPASPASSTPFDNPNGENEGEIIIETDSGLVIDRKKRTDKSDYKNIKEFGKEILKPQEFLNDIFTPLQLNPVAFIQMSRQDQNRMILDLIEFDWDLNWIREHFGEIPQGVDYQQNILVP
jgi:beta-mannosidase